MLEERKILCDMRLNAVANITNATTPADLNRRRTSSYLRGAFENLHDAHVVHCVNEKRSSHRVVGWVFTFDYTLYHDIRSRPERLKVCCSSTTPDVKRAVDKWLLMSWCTRA